MPPIRQASFAGGEIAPELYGRSDVERYFASVRNSRNFIFTPRGAALNRPGTQYVATTKSSGQVRLVPFIYSEDDTYVLEFGNLYIRFFKNGEAVEESPGVPYEVVTPYATADLQRLKFVQVGDVLTIAHGSYTQRELVRSADDDWELSTVPMAELLDPYFLGYDPALIELAADGSGGANGADTSHPAREWTWKVTTIARDSDGNIFESAAFTVESQTDLSGGETYPYTSVPDSLALYPDRPVVVGWPATAGLTSVPADWVGIKVVSHRVYRGRGSLFGFVGETRTRYFVDVGDEPDYTMQPPAGRNPFEVYDEDDTLVRTERPQTVGIYSQRLVYGGTPERGDWFWASKVGDFTNFDQKLVGIVESDAAEFQLAALSKENIRSTLGHDRFYLLTNTGVWSAVDISPAEAPTIRRHTDDGASWLSPIIASDSLLYVRDRSSGVNMLAFDQGRDKLDAEDLSVFAPHMFEGFEVVDWAYAKEPNRIIYAVRSDGVLLALTFSRVLQTVAWTRLDTYGGTHTFENVCVVPEGNEDAVYVVVRRGSSRFIERFASRTVDNATDAVFLDSSVTVTDDDLTTVDGLDHLEGLEVMALVNGNVMGPFTVESGEVDLGITFDEGADPVETTATVGLAYASDFEPLDVVVVKGEVRARRKTVSKAYVEVVASRGLYVGETLPPDSSTSGMREWKQREVSDEYQAIGLHTGVVEVRFESSWNQHGRFALRQVDPLPLSIHGITRMVEFGDE